MNTPTTKKPAPKPSWGAGPNCAESHGSAVSRMHQHAVMEKNYQLRKYGELAQIEAIARHYAAHAQNAIDLMEMINLTRHRPLDENALPFLRMLSGQIIANHAHDLGIELQWPPLPNDQGQTRSAANTEK